MLAAGLSWLDYLVAVSVPLSGWYLEVAGSWRVADDVVYDWLSFLQACLTFLVALGVALLKEMCVLVLGRMRPPYCGDTVMNNLRMVKAVFRLVRTS